MSDDFLPYGRQWIDADDVEAVADVLRGDWLTTGPDVEAFEQALADRCRANSAVAVDSGTAALHCAYRAAGVGPGTEVVVPALTFSATANAARHLRARVRIADIDEQTLTMDPDSLRSLVGPDTAVVAPVDFAGHSARIDAIAEIASDVDAVVVQDAAHSLGGGYRGRPIGSVADMTICSFHPVKAITAGEGGAVVTDDETWAQTMRAFRNHGIVDSEDDARGRWHYDIESIGYNYRITDLQCALGRSQLRKLDRFIERRRHIAGQYRRRLAPLKEVQLPPHNPWCDHAYHLFVIRVPEDRRKAVFDGLRRRGIGVQVHYIPVNMLGAYRRRGHHPRDTPVAWRQYRRLMSIPCFPAMCDADVERVVDALYCEIRGGES